MPPALTRYIAVAGICRAAQLGKDHLVYDGTPEVQTPPPECHPIVIGLRYGIKDRCDRRATSTGASAWLTYIHANQPLTPPASGSAAVSPMGERRRTRTTAGWDLAYALRACPRDAPEPPSTANGRHQQQPVNLKLARALNRRATHGNTLVMRRSRNLAGPRSINEPSSNASSNAVGRAWTAPDRIDRASRPRPWRWCVKWPPRDGAHVERLESVGHLTQFVHGFVHETRRDADRCGTQPSSRRPVGPRPVVGSKPPGRHRLAMAFASMARHRFARDRRLSAASGQA